MEEASGQLILPHLHTVPLLRDTRSLDSFFFPSPSPALPLLCPLIDCFLAVFSFQRKPACDFLFTLSPPITLLFYPSVFPTFFSEYYSLEYFSTDSPGFVPAANIFWKTSHIRTHLCISPPKRGHLSELSHQGADLTDRNLKA